MAMTSLVLKATYAAASFPSIVTIFLVMIVCPRIQKIIALGFPEPAMQADQIDYH
jgi:hypothetical protein